MSLIQQLSKKGMLEKEKVAGLEYEMKKSGKKEEEFLLEKGLVPEMTLFSLKSENLKIPVRSVLADQVPLEILEIVPEETARYYQILPLGRAGNVLEIGMVYPEDFKAQEALKFLARQEKFTYKVFLITPLTFQNLLKQYRTLKGEVGKALDEIKKELDTRGKGDKSDVEFGDFAQESAVTKIVSVILRNAVEGGVSDVHIEPTREKLRIRFRFMGALHSSIFLPIEIHAAVVARVKIISSLKIDETRLPQDGRFSIEVNGKSIDFRVSTFPTTLGEKVAIRVLDPTIGLKTLEELGLEGRNLKTVEEAISKPYGLILVTGPTGSGKTTTLYAVLQLLNKEGVNIVTLEDPVEYFIAGINQSQVKPEIGYDFPTGLRHILRQDPNVVMVGEIRDEATANLVTHAALTGHIVLSTLHTSNTLGVIPRLIDLGVRPFLIPPTLRIAMAQRLVRKLCQDCKKETKPTKEVRDLIMKEIESLPDSAREDIKLPGFSKKQDPDFKIFEPGGCKKCGSTGFAGRIAIFEILSMTDELSNIVTKDPSEANVSAEAKRQGMVLMKQDGILKALRGLTTVEEVLRVAEEK